MAVVVSFVGKWDGKDVARAQREIGQFGNKSTGSMAAFGKKAGIALAAVSVAAVAAAAAVGVAAGKMAMDFETSLSKIQGLVGISAGEIEKMRQPVIDLASEFGKTATQAADAMFFIQSAGLRGTDAMETLEASLKASAAGLGEVNVIADLATSAMNAYGSDVLSASGATDVLTNAVREGKLAPAELAGAMGAVLPIASALGVGFDEIGAAFASMSRTGTDASQAATQVRGILSSLTKETPKGAKALASVGLSYEGLRKQLQDEGLLPTLQTMVGAFDGNTVATSKFFGNVRALTGVMDLLGTNADGTAAIFDSMADSTGVLDEAFSATAETSAFKLQQSFATVKNSLVELGASLTPLVELFAQKFLVLADVFKAMEPLMAPLVAVLTKVSTILADVLLDAVDALIPAIAPLLGVLGALAGAIGPLVAKIIGKVADILVRLLAVVTPLIGPLIQVVFGILDAAWPIIETVVDVVLSLIESLAPLLASVMALLIPLGELTEVLLAALLPIIKPLLPIIEALAVVLAVVLGKAIIVLIGYIGTMIVAWSKFAPFVLNNVVKPVVSHFTSMAGKVLDGAVLMMGWVPGLGDKLRDAQAAFGTFKKNTEKAIGDAADKISKEGTRIGQGMVDSATTAWSSPTATVGVARFGRNTTAALSALGPGLNATADQLGRNAVEAYNRSIAGAEGPKRRTPVPGSGTPDPLIPVPVPVPPPGGGAAAKAVESVRVVWKKIAAAVSEELDLLNVSITGKTKELTGKVAKEFESRMESFKKIVTGQTQIISQARAALDSYASSVVDTIMGKIDFQQTDAEGNPLTPEQIVSLILGDLTNQASAVTALAESGVMTNMPEALAQKILTMDAKAALALADYLAANPEMLTQLDTQYQALATLTETLLGVPMAAAFAKVGDASALQMIADAKARIAKEAASFKQFAKNQLKTTISIDVVYKYINPPSGASITVPANVPKMAAGGIVTTPTLALIGEAGPEAVIPLGRGGGVGGNNYSITINTGVGDPRQIGEEIVNYLSKFESANGAVYAKAT